MTRLKVFNNKTNSTYYLNNVDVNCAKLYSFMGETDNNRKILHKPSPHLDYSIEYSYNTNIDELNALYNHDLSADFSGYFPANHGIILSDLLIDDNCMNYITNRIDCADLSLTTTTYWCPPVIDRTVLDLNQQSTRITSFSYIHKNWLQTVYKQTKNIFMIYNNKILSHVHRDKIFGMYPRNAYSVACFPLQYCSSGAIGVCSTPTWKKPDLNHCTNTCNATWQMTLNPPCKNYKDFSNAVGTQMFNELIIKSWNYNPDSNMSDRGIIYDASMDKWVAQTPNPKSPWGWNDVSNLSKNENIPLLAFGISIPDVSNPTKDDIANIKHYYADLSNNLEPSFNEYRRNNGNPLMPYHIGLDISCLTRQDCSNPFFDLSLILNLKS